MDTTEITAPETVETNDATFDEGWDETPAPEESVPVTENPTTENPEPEPAPVPESDTAPEEAPAPEPEQPAPSHPPASSREPLNLGLPGSPSGAGSAPPFPTGQQPGGGPNDARYTDLTRELDALGGMDAVRDIMGLVRELSQSSNMTLQQFADNTRASLIARRDNVDMAVAAERAKTERLQRADQARQQQETARREADQRRNADFAAFISAYPDVQAKDIPQEVWQSVRQGQSLVTAYAMHDAKAARAEIARMKAEAETARKNAENRAKAAPSATTAGSPSQTPDAFEEGWDID